MTGKLFDWDRGNFLGHSVALKCHKIKLIVVWILKKINIVTQLSDRPNQVWFHENASVPSYAAVFCFQTKIFQEQTSSRKALDKS